MIHRLQVVLRSFCILLKHDWLTLAENEHSAHGYTKNGSQPEVKISPKRLIGLNSGDKKGMLEHN